jgi:hypothetical protein
VKLAAPLKSAAGVNVTVPPTRLTVPSTGALTAVTLNVCVPSFAGPPESFASSSLLGNVSGTSSGVVRASLTAVGWSFTATTVIVTVAVFELRAPSLTRYVKESVPLTSALGM